MPQATIRLTFLGAAGTVTGSKYLVEHDRTRVLIDCGLFQGKKELRLRNWDRPPFEARDLSAVVLTHAHIDHTGYLPRLIREGYNGPIYCTAPTKELTTLLLRDSAHLQQEEADFANRHGTSKHKPAQPLYTEEEAVRAQRLLQAIPRDVPSQVAAGMSITPTCAGHILGACALSLDVGGRRISFSGDIGRFNTPLLPDPKPVALGNLLLCEATYGDRDHGPEDSDPALARIVHEAAARGGPLLIPAFALGRTQTLLYSLSALEREGKIPVLPVYVDSPMAIDATRIYRAYANDYDEEAAELVSRGIPPLLTERTQFCRTADESKALNNLTGPRIIISASGMVTGGRILHHMKLWLPDERATVLFVGYQAEETRGRTILSGASKVRIFGADVPIRAQRAEISGLSAHGDRGELLRWLRSSSGTPATVRIVHSEPGPAAAFSSLVARELGWDPVPARHLEVVEL